MGTDQVIVDQRLSFLSPSPPRHQPGAQKNGSLNPNVVEFFSDVANDVKRLTPITDKTSILKEYTASLTLIINLIVKK
jgi:hypothetical protein